MAEKYKNGMYKGQSKAQELISDSIFKAFKDNGLLESMGLNLNQESGNCQYDYKFYNNKTEYYIVLNRKGEIIDSGFIG